MVTINLDKLLKDCKSPEQFYGPEGLMKLLTKAVIERIKKINFIFSEKIGFMAKAGIEYFPVTFLGIKNKGNGTHIPDVTKLLLEKYYYADTKEHVA